MNILILNKRKFNDFMSYSAIDDSNVENEDMMIISINNWANPEHFMGKNDIYSHFKRQHPNVMIMHFGDYGEEYVARVAWEGPTGIFTPYKAEKLFKFIEENKYKKLAVIHCGAGISRSGAVGAFIYDLGYYDGTWDEFKRKNPKIEPNSHILRLLHEQKRKYDNESKKS